MYLTDNVTDYLLTKMTPYAPIVNGVFTGISEEIVCRPLPSNVAETRFLDETVAGEQNFEYMAKSKNQSTARTTLTNISAVLDLAFLDLSDGQFIKLEAVTAPVFVSTTEAGEYIYSAGFRLEYLLRGT
jgi:Bacteriophage minor capsid protein